MKEFTENQRSINRTQASEPAVPNAPLADGEFSARENICPERHFTRLVEQYSTPLLRLCFLYLRSRESAEDAVQETMLRVYRNLGTALSLPSNSEKAWITTIAVNICRDMLRSAWNRRVSITDAMAEIPCEDPCPMDDTLLIEVMGLKTKHREVILLFYYEDMKIADIARLLNVPEGTVSVRLKRAREQLKARLGGWFDA